MAWRKEGWQCLSAVAMCVSRRKCNPSSILPASSQPARLWIAADEVFVLLGSFLAAKLQDLLAFAAVAEHGDSLESHLPGLAIDGGDVFGRGGLRQVDGL